MTQTDSTHSEKTPFDNFADLARRLFAVPKHELDEEIAKEKAESKAEKPPRKTKQHERKELPSKGLSCCL